jgi:hypothetical protein
MSNTKNVLFMEGVLISILASAYRSFIALTLCLILVLGITLLRTKFWIMAFTTLLTIIWGLIGFITGYYFHSLSAELILVTICLSLATGIHMVYLNTDDFIALEKKQGKSRDC